MKLAYRHFPGPAARPLVILHGLLGSSRNWLSVAKHMQADFDVYLPDLRNHGQSPHDDPMSFADMTGDVLGLMDTLALGQACLMGHSLGGKVAMLAACEQPQRIRSLVVVDIAPRVYAPHHGQALGAMRKLDVAALESRRHADTLLAGDIPDWGFRQFVLTNLTPREGQAGYRWIPNLPAIIRERMQMADTPLAAAGHKFAGPVLCLRGEKSAFVSDQDFISLQTHFPNAILHTQAGAGHDPHVDDRGALVRTVRDFLLADAAHGG